MAYKFMTRLLQITQRRRNHCCIETIIAKKYGKLSRRARKRHGGRVLQIGHHDRRDGQHEARHDLLGVVVQLGVREGDARAVDGHPRGPLHPHHQGAHGEHHSQDVHVIRGEVVAGHGPVVAAAPAVGSCIGKLRRD